MTNLDTTNTYLSNGIRALPCSTFAARCLLTLFYEAMTVDVFAVIRAQETLLRQ